MQEYDTLKRLVELAGWSAAHPGTGSQRHHLFRLLRSLPALGDGAPRPDPAGDAEGGGGLAGVQHPRHRPKGRGQAAAALCSSIVPALPKAR